MKEISVIIPVYNSEKYLRDCIESIIKCKELDVELILIDDGSKDLSLSICNEYAKENKNILVIHKENTGVSSTRNIGIEASNGRYMMFVDSDDFINPCLIEKLYINMKNSDFAMCGYTIYDEESKQNSATYICSEFRGDISTFAENVSQYINPPLLLGPCFKMFDSKIIKDNHVIFPEDMDYGEDAIFVLKYLQYVSTVSCFNYSGYFYRKHGSETLSSGFKEYMLDNDEILNHELKIFLKRNNVHNVLEICDNFEKDAFNRYAQRLMISELRYKNKKKLFYFKATKYGIKSTKKKATKLSGSDLIISLALRFKILFFMLKLFELKSK